MTSRSMSEEARHRLGEIEPDVKTLLVRHRAIKAQIVEAEREVAYATTASVAWKYRAEIRILHCMTRLLSRRINALKKEALK